ncbi:hypothetical protein NC651_032257 [Populus alba x Populus x berolinensis]|nr:hypothetical protein NC651_032257 [Populus alba x Populus x berolinensis]
MQYYCSKDSDHTKKNQFQFLRSIADGANLGSKKKGLLMVNILEKKEPESHIVFRDMLVLYSESGGLFLQFGSILMGHVLVNQVLEVQTKLDSGVYNHPQERSQNEPYESKTLDTFSSMVKLFFLQMKHENKRRRGEKKGNNGGLAGRGRSGMAGASEGTLDGDKIGPSN